MMGGGFNLGSLVQWLTGMGIIAGLGAAAVAYAASGTADEAKTKAESAVTKNHQQQTEIEVLKTEQTHIKQGVDDTKEMVRALLEAQQIPDPTR